MKAEHQVDYLEKIVQNPYENVYWFARMFVDTVEVEKARNMVCAVIFSFFKGHTKARSMAERPCRDLESMLQKRLIF